jgi:sortase A
VDRLRSALSAIGAVLTGTGVLILLFVAYQLWGTGVYTAQQQDTLKADFEARAAIPEGTTTTTAPPNAPPTPAPPPPPSGEAVAIIRIPAIGVDKAVVEGVSLKDLRKGPGHYPGTPLPGEEGNAAIAGHRTTYGAPFNRLDELDAGDEILVTTLRGSYTYKVESKTVVRPDQVEVLDPTPTPRLTLTTCHPKYSASQRLVIAAGLAPGETALPVLGPPVPPPGESEQAAPTELADAGLASERSKTPTVLWGIATALVGAAWWWAVRRRRHWTTYAAGVLPFLAVLFVFYANLELLLPANF